MLSLVDKRARHGQSMSKRFSAATTTVAIDNNDDNDSKTQKDLVGPRDLQKGFESEGASDSTDNQKGIVLVSPRRRASIRSFADRIAGSLRTFFLGPKAGIRPKSLGAHGDRGGGGDGDGFFE